MKLLDFEKQVNHRIHTTTKKTPIELYNLEVAQLSPLPNNRFIGVSEELRKVSSDCLISVDGNRYSVPHIFAGREVWIRISQGIYLEIYSQSNKLIAKYTLEKTDKGKIFINKEHFQGYRGCKGTWDFLSQQFLTIAPDQDDFINRLKAQKRINPSRHLTVIIEAAKHFSKKDIENVIQLCNKYNVYRSDLFVDLLYQNSEPVSIPKQEHVNDHSISSPPGIIRSLDSYRTKMFVERSGEI